MVSDPEVPAPNVSGMLEVQPDVEIYWEERGNPEGSPLVYLHGGPGSGLNRRWFQTFDTGRHRLISLDQRGCGRSRPSVSERPDLLAENTTGHLIADLEALRVDRGIGRWVVSGVSWGSTLALAYALEHPERVSGLLLAAVTTTGREEVDWITEGVGRIFPEAWDRFVAASGRRPGERVVEAYARRLRAGDRVDRAAAALDWDRWEAAHVSLDTPGWRETLFDDPEARLTFATLVTHYWANDGFLPGDRAILARAGELSDIPTLLLHGRRDVSGPAITAWRVHERIANSRLEILEDTTHAGPRMWPIMRAALEELEAGRWSPGPVGLDPRSP